MSTDLSNASLEECEAVIARALGRPPGSRTLRRRTATRADVRPHVVYRHYDTAGQLLYVGISLDLAARTGAHRWWGSWWRQVSRIEVEHLPDRASALARESDLIESLRPLHNRAGMTR